MSKIAILLADGFEAIEALAPCDILRRAGEEASLVTINAKPQASDSHGITVVCDATVDTYDFDECDLVVFPGGQPGTNNLRANTKACELACDFMSFKKVAAICAAPSILAELGLLEGRTATCYPGCEGAFPAGVRPEKLGVYADGNLVTASGPAFAVEFGYELLRLLGRADAADQVAKAMLAK